MQAFFLVKHAGPADSFELREIPKPQPGKGEICIHVSAFGLNYSDIMARQGLYRECPPLPTVIGYDVEGTIDAVGSAVTGFKEGDRVFALTRFGGYAQYARTKVEAVNILPDDAPVGTGCALATQSVTAYHALVHSQTLLPGEKILIHAAAGGVGTALVQIARWKNCIVIGVVGGKEKAEYLRSQGVEHIVDHHETSYLDYVARHYDNRVDVVVDNAGGASIQKAKSILAPGGRLISMGAASLSGKKSMYKLLKLVTGFGLFSPIAYLGKSQSLIGINMLRIADHRPDILSSEFKSVAALYDEGILKPHIGKIFNHTQLPEAHSWMQDRKSIGKGVVKW